MCANPESAFVSVKVNDDLGCYSYSMQNETT